MKKIIVLLSFVVSSSLFATARSARAEAGYDGGFFVTGEKGDATFKLRLGMRLQTRLTIEMFEDDGKDTKASFAVRRGRLLADGHVFSKALTYKLQADFGNGVVALKDFYWNYAFSDGVQLRAGQWKKPFSRQQITSSSRQELVDRAPTDSAFGAGRDVGILLHNDYEETKGMLEWALGVFNGAGENGVPDLWLPLGVARIGVQSEGFGKGRYTEGDLECADSADACGARWAVALAATADGGMPKDGDKGDIGAELDFLLKVSGFALSGAFFLDFNLGAEEEGGGLEKTGFYAQASYFIAGPKLLPVVRFASIMPDSDAVATKRELTLGLGFMPLKHNLKWQTDATMVMNELAGVSTTDWVIRTQASLGF